MNYATLLQTATLKGAIAELEALLESGQETFLAFDETNLEQPLAKSKWSRKEIIGHLIDSALNNLQRFTRAQIPAHLENGQLIAQDYAQNDWVKLGKYNLRSSVELIELWDNLNMQILSVMQDISASSLAVLCVFGSNEPVRLEDVFISYVGHVKHHLIQLGGQE